MRCSYIVDEYGNRCTNKAKWIGVSMGLEEFTDYIHPVVAISCNKHKEILDKPKKLKDRHKFIFDYHRNIEEN